jgi:ABC-2 type transport system permease protein
MMMSRVARLASSSRHSLHAEWTKLRTSPGTVGLLLAVVVATIGVSVLASAATTCASGGCGRDLTKLSLAGVQLGQAVVAILAVLIIGNEYSTGMVRVTLTALPRRTGVLVTKAVILTVFVAAAAVLAVLGSLAAGRLILPAHEFVLRSAVGSVLYLVLVGLMSLGTATAVRNPGAAIGIVLGLIYVFPIVTQVVTDPAWQKHLQQVGPMSAGLAVQTTVDVDALPIGPWKGLGVLALWALAALLAGGLLFERRDA